MSQPYITVHAPISVLTTSGSASAEMVTPSKSDPGDGDGHVMQVTKKG